MDMKRMQSRPVGESGVGRASGPEKRAASDKGGVSESDAKRMTKALGKDVAKDGQPPTVAGEGQQPAPEGMASLFSQALGRLTGQPAEAGQEGAAGVFQTPGTPAAEAMDGARCGELVDRILASSPAADGTAEVRIKIDKPWLPDTEVRLTLTPDSRLEVEFQTDSVDSQRFLMPNLENLRGRLAERCDGGVSVRMTESSGDSGGDGRSRNRRDVIEELDGE